jgi:manganese/zinc/iron transport system permease protein
MIGGVEWSWIDAQIILVGALVGAACALPGALLMLRRMSMMGDALSHAVLPGLAIAFIVTGSRDSLTMLAGAAAIGLLTAVLIETLHRHGQVDSGAAMGVVFTVLFAIGLVLMRFGANAVDLDPNCVLYGAIEYTPLHTVPVFGFPIPRAAILAATALAINALCILLLYKEFKISAFDPALATAVGISARRMHYLLMAMTALTSVAAFESVGSILVIAMLVVPAATASLLTHRFGFLLIQSVVLAVISAALGHFLAVAGPGWFGARDVDTSTAGMTAVATGLLFLGAVAYRAVWRLWAVRIETP